MKILFVCTGNTCRSPMAQVMAAQLFGEEVTVISAGVMAEPNSGASANAVAVMKERQIGLTGHKAQLLTEALLESADLVLTMTTSHKAAICQGSAVDKVYTLGEYAGCNVSVSDPYGGGIEVYRACADEIYELLLKIRDKVKKCREDKVE